MAITTTVYGAALEHLTDADIDWVADTIKVSLHTASYSPDQDTHATTADLTDEVANGNGYTTGGVELQNKTRGYTAGTNIQKLDADDIAWTGASFTFRYAVIYKSTGELLAYVDFGGDETASSGRVDITWNASGIITLNTP